MILHPQDSLDFWKHKGHALSEIYHYEPTYIEYLIEYLPGFEIDVKEFEALPKPVRYCNNDHTVKTSAGNTITLALRYRPNSIKDFLCIPKEYLQEFDYKLPDKFINILSLKSKGEYKYKPYEFAPKARTYNVKEM